MVGRSSRVAICGRSINIECMKIPENALHMRKSFYAYYLKISVEARGASGI